MMSEDGFSVSATTSSSIRGFVQDQQPPPNPNPNPTSNPLNKKKRSLPGTPDPDAEVVAMSPKSLMATNRFLCEICNKGFQRDQNLQLHRRGHNLPWKLKQKSKQEVVRRKVYICPEKTCVHHDPSRALGDLTGIKKHYSRKHGEKKWKCEKCSKKYAVQSDWKAHSKICGTREYRCDCGTLFSRKDSFITHRAFCDALAEESARSFSSVTAAINANFRTDLFNGAANNSTPQATQFSSVFRPDFAGPNQLVAAGSLNVVDEQKTRLPMWLDHHGNSQLNPIGGVAGNSNAGFLPELVQTTMPMNFFGSLQSQAQWLNNNGSNGNNNNSDSNNDPSLLSALPPRGVLKEEEDQNNGDLSESVTSLYSTSHNNSNSHQHHGPTTHMSATALLQKAAQMGSTRSNNNPSFSHALMTSSSSSFSNISNYNQFVKTLPSSDSSGMTQLMMQNSGKPSQLSQGGEGSLTRDFLGVGGEGSRPFSQQELAKFASLSSAAGIDLMSQYGNH